MSIHESSPRRPGSSVEAVSPLNLKPKEKLDPFALNVERFLNPNSTHEKRTPASMYEGVENKPIITIVANKHAHGSVSEAITTITMPHVQKKDSIFVVDLSGVRLVEHFMKTAEIKGVPLQEVEFSPEAAIKHYKDPDVAAALIVDSMTKKGKPENTNALTSEIATIFRLLRKGTDGESPQSLKKLDDAISVVTGQTKVDDKGNLNITGEDGFQLKLDLTDLQEANIRGYYSQRHQSSKTSMLGEIQTHVRTLLDQSVERPPHIDSTSPEKMTQIFAYVISKQGQDTSAREAFLLAHVKKMMESNRINPDRLIIAGAEYSDMISDIIDTCTIREPEERTNLVIHYSDPMKSLDGLNGDILSLGNLVGDVGPLVERFGKKKVTRESTGSGQYHVSRSEDDTHKVSPDALQDVQPGCATLITARPDVEVFRNLPANPPPGAKYYEPPRLIFAEQPVQATEPPLLVDKIAGKVRKILPRKEKQKKLPERTIRLEDLVHLDVPPEPEAAGITFEEIFGTPETKTK